VYNYSLADAAAKLSPTPVNPSDLQWIEAASTYWDGTP
jgi:hypothetical protein